MAKIVQHPGCANTPLMTIAEVLGFAQEGRVADCVVIFTDTDGEMHIAWSKQTNADLAASAVVLTTIAASKIME
jgi:hypothetical protein